MTKLGKLYELMAYGDDLDAFYSMNKRVTKAGHTECDREIMDLLNEAKKEFPDKANSKYWADYAIGMLEGTFCWREYLNDIAEWRKKWFGEPL